MSPRRSSPSTARNRAPIFAVLQRILPERAAVVEIACGAGEHAVFFAAAQPGWDWTPCDPDPEARASTAAWIEEEGVTNVRAPREVDARAADWDVEDGAYDAVVSINMIHIAPWEAALGLFAGAARALKPGGTLYLYGPFKRDGAHTAPSNEAFDASLKSRDPSWGVRDLGDVERAAAERGFALREVVEMPANNLSVVFVRA